MFMHYDDQGRLVDDLTGDVYEKTVPGEAEYIGDNIITGTLDFAGRALDLLKELSDIQKEYSNKKYYGFFTHYVCLADKVKRLVDRNNGLINSVKEGKIKSYPKTSIEISDELMDEIYCDYKWIKTKPDCKNNKENLKMLKNIYKKASDSNFKMGWITDDLRYK